MLLAELNLDMIAREDRALDRELRHRAVFVFHLNVEIIMRQHLIAEIENLRERAGS